MAARLKVFVSSDGFTDYVVAASSRPKALAAWGAHQDLFKTGGARETDDPDLVKAALEHPGEVLRRPAGSRGVLADIKPAKKPKPKAPSKAALKRVQTLEAKLATEAETHAAELEHIEAARAALETREAREAERHEKARRRIETDLAAARKALKV